MLRETEGSDKWGGRSGTGLSIIPVWTHEGCGRPSLYIVLCMTPALYDSAARQCDLTVKFSLLRNIDYVCKITESTFSGAICLMVR